MATVPVVPAEGNQNAVESPMEGVGSEINPLKRNRHQDDHEYSAAGPKNSNRDASSSEPPSKIPELDGNKENSELPPGSALTTDMNGSGDNSKSSGNLDLTDNPNDKTNMNLSNGKNVANFDLSMLTKEFKEVVQTEIRAVHTSLEDMKGALNCSKNQMSLMQDKLQSTEATAQAAAEGVADLNQEFHLIREEWSTMKLQASFRASHNDLRSVRAQIEKLEWYSRRFNIIIDGIQEPEGETPTALAQKVDSFIANRLGLTSVKFDITHRLGPKIDKKQRRVIVKFGSLTDKQTVWEARHRLKAREGEKQQFRLIMDKPKATKERESMCFRIVNEAQRSSRYRSAKFQGGKIWLDGTSYDQDELDLLPEELRPAYISSPRTPTAIVFFSTHSYLSNHHLSLFSFEGILYSSMEQFLARERASFANNEREMKRALLSDDPQDHKRALNKHKADGRDEEWRQHISTRILPALEAKFLQNEAAREFLLGTRGRQIGEASLDSNWGIGMTLTDHRVFNTSLWGTNILGKALMAVRNVLK